MHLPPLTLNSDPNNIFTRVDFPVLYGPITLIGIKLAPGYISWNYSSAKDDIYCINSILILLLSPSINSKGCPFKKLVT